jgi:hypothetical protein
LGILVPSDGTDRGSNPRRPKIVDFGADEKSPISRIRPKIVDLCVLANLRFANVP